MAVEYNLKVLGNKKQAVALLGAAEKAKQITAQYQSTGD